MAQNKIAPKQEKDSQKAEMARRFKSNPGVFIGTLIVLALVIVSFVLVPAIVPEFTRGRNLDLTFGYYDRVPISFVPGNYFAQRYDMLSRHFRVEPGSFQYMQLWRMAFEAAVVHTAILQQMQRAGYTVPEHVVDRAVARRPDLQENGVFSVALWRRIPETNQLAIRRQTKEEFTKNIYLYDMTSLLSSEAEGLFIGRMAERMRSFDMVSFSLDDYPDSEFIAFAEENHQLFRSIHLSRISISGSERDARQVLGSIQAGDITFEDAAWTHSDDEFASRGGDMGVRLFFELQHEITSPADLERLINLERGALSDVIRIGDHWAFFRVEEELRPADFSDHVIMERVRTYVRNFARGRMEDWAISQAMDFIADANAYGFENALRESGQQRRSFGPLPINYGNVDLFTSLQFFHVPELTHSASDANFWRTIFSAPVNTLSSPLVQGSNVLVFLPTEEIETEETMIEGIASTVSSFWLSHVMEQSIHSYFLNSDRLDDRFFATYFNLFMAPGF